MYGARLRRVGVIAIAYVLLVGCGASGPAATPTASGNVEGGDVSKLPTAPMPSQSPSLPNPSTPASAQQFVTTAFDDVQAFWSNSFAAAGLPYTPARLVLFMSSVGTSCGPATSDVGPFYCSGDDTVYLDLRFFAALEQHLGISGDFSLAYVVAHEVGHHIQNLMGITQRVAHTDQQDPALTNGLSVRVELQADCLAGVWAHSTYERNLLEPGDLDEALAAAAAAGDDFLQQLGSGQVEPEKWTHGSSAQRQRWLATGFDSGRPADCNTFAGSI